MNQSETTDWRTLKSDASREVESVLRKHFQEVDAYEVSSYSIRLRIIDDRFSRLRMRNRHTLLNVALTELSDELNSRIWYLLLISVEEALDDWWFARQNADFENPFSDEEE